MTALLAELRVLPHVVAYEWRKASAFRMGLVIRELLRGLGRPVVAVFVYVAMFESAGVSELSGYTLHQLLAYLVWSSVIFKCLTDEKSLDVADQIFDGYITKYLVMPVRFFTLVLGRFVQLTGLQLISSMLFWAAGAALAPSYWPYPSSALAFLQALLLVVLGAYCYLLVHFILSCLAFWLDVVWSLLAMFRFVASFVSGLLVPIAMMPDAINQAFSYLFPYWTLFAPVELLLGRMGSEQVARGVLVLGVWIVVLQALAAFTWRRGIARYAGAGA
jgi:ABC-2 type transport system permease protein